MRTVSALSPAVVAALVIASCLARPACANELTVEVTDRNGDPVGNVAVYLTPADSSAVDSHSPSLPAGATMEQIENMFVPHMLVVETGAQVSFPNNDSVSHHVYSFSEAKRFQLDLYRGNVHPPQLFDRPGLVVLGCNIHDSMLGYILVVDTPYSSITTAQGSAVIDALPAGDYDLLVWTPRAKPDDLPKPVPVTIASDGGESVAVRLTSKLSPPHDMLAGSLTWKDY